MQKIPFLAASLFLMLAGNARADEVTFTTARTVGQTVALAVNADAGATLTWNGGTSVALTGGALNEITVEADKATITSTGTITRLNLTGNEITAIGLNNAPSLKRLLVADNKLSALTLTKNTELEELDAQNNELKTLNLNYNKQLVSLNVANNNLTTLTCNAFSTLESFVVAGNELTTVRNLASFAALQQFWPAGNAIEELKLTKATGLKQLFAGENKLALLELPASTELTDLLVQNNRLDTLDLTVTPQLVTIMANDNNLNLVTWHTDTKRTCKTAYLQNNRLFFNSFPFLNYSGQPLNVVITPQRPHAIGNYFEPNTAVNLTSTLNKTGWGQTQNAEVTFADAYGAQLVLDTDYTVSGNSYTFLSKRDGVTLSATTTRYPDITLTTAPFGVGSTVGIDQIEADGKALEVFSLAGVRLGNSLQGLPAGVYIVNGKKVMLK